MMARSTRAAPGRRRPRADGDRRLRRSADAEALRRADAAGAFCDRAGPNPDLLVLDEPTAALDVEGRHAFWATMQEFTAGGQTVLFATHYLEEADAFADRVVLMSDGAIVADGPPNEIKAMVGTRTIRATLPGRRAGGARRLPGVTAPSAEARRWCSPATTPTPRSGRCSRRIPPPTTSRSPAPGSRRPSSG